MTWGVIVEYVDHPVVVSLEDKNLPTSTPLVLLRASCAGGSAHRKLRNFVCAQSMWQEMCFDCRSTSVSNLMYIKEDLILQHNLSFYDLIISKARGKSGPLFHFDVYDDVRLEHNANVEKEESHAGMTLCLTAFSHVFVAV